MKGLKNDAVYKREIDKDGVVTIYCDSTFTVWKKDKGATDFDIVVNPSVGLRHCKLRVSAGDTIELVTEGNFSFDFIEVQPRLEIPTGEKLLELVENKPDNIKDLVRAQVLAEMSMYNEQNGGESLEEFDDFSHMDDEFNDAPLAEAEMILMQEEYEAIQSDELIHKQQEAVADTSSVKDDTSIGDAGATAGNTNIDPQPETN